MVASGRGGVGGRGTSKQGESYQEEKEKYACGWRGSLHHSEAQATYTPGLLSRRDSERSLGSRLVKYQFLSAFGEMKRKIRTPYSVFHKAF